MTRAYFRGMPDRNKEVALMKSRRGRRFKSGHFILLFCLFALCAKAENLREQVVAAGVEPLVSFANVLNSSKAVAEKAFDGVCTNALGDNARCLGASGMQVTFGFPDSLVPDGKKLAVTRYRVYQLNGGSSAHSRAPRAWMISGSTDNVSFSAVDSRSGVEWYADSHAIGNDDPLPAGIDNWQEYALDPSVVTDWRFFKLALLQS